MKKYKIDNLIVYAENPIRAVKIAKMCDASIVRDVNTDIEYFDRNIKNARSMYEINKILRDLYTDESMNRLGKNWQNLVNKAFAKSEEFLKFNKKDSIQDMPLAFRSNVNLAAFKSNIQNYINDPMNISSLIANLQGINADHQEWIHYHESNTFLHNPELKRICNSLAEKYINELKKISTINGRLKQQICDCLDLLNRDTQTILR